MSEENGDQCFCWKHLDRGFVGVMHRGAVLLPLGQLWSVLPDSYIVPKHLGVGWYSSTYCSTRWSEVEIDRGHLGQHHVFGKTRICNWEITFNVCVTDAAATSRFSISADEGRSWRSCQKMSQVGGNAVTALSLKLLFDVSVNQQISHHTFCTFALYESIVCLYWRDQ